MSLKNNSKNLDLGIYEIMKNPRSYGQFSSSHINTLYLFIKLLRG